MLLSATKVLQNNHSWLRRTEFLERIENMKTEDIVEMIEKAGLCEPRGKIDNFAQLERFANLVAAAEREACAKLAMTISVKGLPEKRPEGNELLRSYDQIVGGVLIADAIRSRDQA